THHRLALDGDEVSGDRVLDDELVEVERLVDVVVGGGGEAGRDAGQQEREGVRGARGARGDLGDPERIERAEFHGGRGKETGGSCQRASAGIGCREGRASDEAASERQGRALVVVPPDNRHTRPRSALWCLKVATPGAQTQGLCGQRVAEMLAHTRGSQVTREVRAPFSLHGNDRARTEKLSPGAAKKCSG